jgi:hypothetical protein
MSKLNIEDLHSLESYAKLRSGFRARVIEHKRNRRVALGEHVALIFEDRLTMQYQVQEMLRIERIFEEAAILDELSAYNPLIPDGSNWKATMMIEYPDVDERREALRQLAGVEHQVWVQVPGLDRIVAIADEDMERSTESKTSAVHFLRFELSAETIAALRSGAALEIGVSHSSLEEQVTATPEMHKSLLADLD